MFIRWVLSCSDFLWMTCLTVYICCIHHLYWFLRNLFPSLTWVWRSTLKAAQLYERHFQICIHHSSTLFAVSYRKEGPHILDSFGISVWLRNAMHACHALMDLGEKTQQKPIKPISYPSTTASWSKLFFASGQNGHIPLMNYTVHSFKFRFNKESPWLSR